MTISVRDALHNRKRLLKKISSLAILLFILTGIGFAEEKKEKPNPALIRSLVFPGWGQIYEKQYIKGFFYIAVEGFCLVQAILANYQGNQAYWNYRFASTAQEAVEFRSLTQKYDRKRNLYIFVSAGVWIISMADIYLHVKKQKKRNEKQVLIFPWWSDDSKGMGVSIIIGF